MRFRESAFAIGCFLQLVISVPAKNFDTGVNSFSFRRSDDRGRFKSFDNDQTSEDPKGLIRQTEYQLDRITSQMSSFVENLEFNYVEFGLQSRGIEEKILDLTFLVSRAMQYKRPLLGRLRFVQNMFRVMLDAANGLEFFLRTKIDHIYVRKLLQLNVALLTSAHTQTLPPTQEQLRLFENKISDCRYYLHIWQREFSALENVPESVSFMFQIQCSMAEHTIHVYQGHLPEKVDTRHW